MIQEQVLKQGAISLLLSKEVNPNQADTRWWRGIKSPQEVSNLTG